MQDGAPEREIREFEINFMKETKLGDNITISGADGAMDSALAQSLFVGIREGDGAEAFRSRICWDGPVE